MTVQSLSSSSSLSSACLLSISRRSSPCFSLSCCAMAAATAFFSAANSFLFLNSFSSPNTLFQYLLYFFSSDSGIRIASKGLTTVFLFFRICAISSSARGFGNLFSFSFFNSSHSSAKSGLSSAITSGTLNGLRFRLCFLTFRRGRTTPWISGDMMMRCKSLFFIMGRGGRYPCPFFFFFNKASCVLLPYKWVKHSTAPSVHTIIRPKWPPGASLSRLRLYTLQ